MCPRIRLPLRHTVGQRAKHGKCRRRVDHLLQSRRLTKLDSSQISVNANIVLPSIHYEADSATDFTGLPVQGSKNGKITKTTVAPHIYGAYKVNDNLTVGLGVYVPFGSATEYEKDSVLRHNINKLGLTSIAVEPVAAWKLNERHSFGAGIIAQHNSAELRKYAD
ncbi:TPA: outer membrane protein transport protein [Neisseria gonorrhoeae]